MGDLKTIVRLSIALSPIFAVTACAQYLDRKETIYFGAGEAVATDALAHTYDPWPVHARNTRIVTSGERYGAAVRRYQSPPQDSGNPSTVINVR